MFFTSLTYLGFLPVVAIIFYLIPSRFQWLWLLLCSSLFYFTILPGYLPLFYGLIILNYLLGISIEKQHKHRNLVYFLSILINIAVLAFFKYFRSLGSNLSGSVNNNPVLILLPVGLSFFVFLNLSYLIEIKRNTMKAERHLGVFASSLLFFPKILQGPIDKPFSLIPQFREAKRIDYFMISEGSKQMLWGFFKKLVVADRLAVYVDTVYGNIQEHSGPTLLIAAILYSFQIYADFSGYTDIALGSAKILGYNLINNFKRPYFASSIKEFWDRWHISFSTWLRDYIFLPLAVLLAGRSGARKVLGLAPERWIFMVAITITFAICGVWHGEGLHFLIWGLIFSVYLTSANWMDNVYKTLRKKLHISKKSMFLKLLNIIITFSLVSFAWIFFRADSTETAFTIIQKIFTFKGEVFFDYQTFTHGLFGIVILLLADIAAERSGSLALPFKTNHWLKETIIYVGLVSVILLTGVLDKSQFIYFKF